MGFNIGISLADELLAKMDITSTCKTFKNAINIIVRHGFKIFFGVNVDVNNWLEDNTAVTIAIVRNPLTQFVALPLERENLHYCTIFGGIIRGALEQIGVHVSCKFIEHIQSYSENNIRVSLEASSSDLEGGVSKQK